MLLQARSPTLTHSVNEVIAKTWSNIDVWIGKHRVWLFAAQRRRLGITITNYGYVTCVVRDVVNQGRRWSQKWGGGT